MCDSAESNWVWTVRDARTGQAVRSVDGYEYFFADESEAAALRDRLGQRDLTVVQVREPGA